jgi:aspartyl-tRNA(Asn)/glutamyl-tRNA(Gln) amidotransferase subunit B
LRYLDVSDADMEKGQMRIEANISLTKKEGKFGTKVEIKNLNSFKALEEALSFEIKRQKRILESGKKVIQETRGWNDFKKKTFSQRIKEVEKDYRYFPEPDLPPLHITKEILDEIKKEIPELPFQKRKRFLREYELDEKSIEIFVKNRELSEFFEKVVSEFDPGLEREKLLRLINLAKNYILSDLLGILKEASISNEDFLITPENFAQFIELIEKGKISSKIAKEILSEMFKTGADPSHIIEEKDWTLISEKEKIEKIVKGVILKNQKAVLDYKKGKKGALQFLIGQVMKETKGKADPKITKEILTRFLKEE